MEKQKGVAERLRSEIISGILSESTPFRELALVKRFNIGCTKKREVLIQLVNEGLVSYKKFWVL